MPNTIFTRRISRSPLRDEGHGLSRIVLGWLILVLVWGAGPNFVLAQEKQPETNSEFREPETTPEQQRTVTAAIYLLVALTMGIVTLLILLMLWGARVRREARKPLASTTPNDPLWYLKKSAKPPLREPNLPDDVSEETTEPNKPSDEDPKE